MLKPAILHKDEIEKKFAEKLYTDDYFYYTGYAHCNSLPEIKAEDNVYQFAVVNGDRVIGYLAYRIDSSVDCVSNFGLISFDAGNPIIGKDLFEKMEELVATYHRVEWRMIGGNPVKRSYDKFCKRHNGNCVVLHDVCKNQYGEWLDEYVYEIINKYRNGGD